MRVLVIRGNFLEVGTKLLFVRVARQGFAECVAMFWVRCIAEAFLLPSLDIDPGRLLGKVVQDAFLGKPTVQGTSGHG